MKKLLLVLAFAFAGHPAVAEDLKTYKLKIGDQTIDLDAGETEEFTLPNGEKTTVSISRNEFSTFKGDKFTFVYPENMTVAKSQLGNNIVQYFTSSALGSMVIVQEYGSMDPSTLTPLMLQQLTKESVQAGATLEQKPTTRQLKQGASLSGVLATVKSSGESVDYEIVTFGKDSEGLIAITRIDQDNRDEDGKIIDRFWDSLTIKE